jgi:hypothetical protein
MGVLTRHKVTPLGLSTLSFLPSALWLEAKKDAASIVNAKLQ